MPIDDILMDCEEQMEKATDHLKHELRGIRTGRANPALVETIKVDYYGSPTDIKAIAMITVPEFNQILIKPFTPGDLKAIEKAISESKLGLPTSSDGRQVRLTLPAMSQERRQQLVGQTKGIGEETKIRIRNARRDSNKLVETEEKGGLMTEDEATKAKEQIQDLTKQYETKVEEMLEHKRQEILQV